MSLNETIDKLNNQSVSEDFFYRTITKGGSFHVSAHRTRTSAGFSSIEIRCGQQVMRFTSDLLGDKYEEALRELIRVAGEIVSHPCQLPKELP